VNGTVAQAVALVCHGNAFLRGLGTPPDVSANSTMQFVASVRFIEEHRGWLWGRRERLAATSVHAWFEELRRREHDRLLLRCLAPERLPDAVGLAPLGDGPWELASSGRQRGERRWSATWEVGDREEPERRIWHLTYRGRAHAREAVPRASLEACREALVRALGPITAFSREVAGGAFLEAFEGARSTLERGEPRGFHRDLAPEGALPALAARLLDACQVGWVFGGMGWWNDAFYEGEAGRRFEDATHGYWRALSAAIVAAANSSAARTP